MRNMQTLVLALLMVGSLAGLSACTRADNIKTGESYIRGEDAPDSVMQQRADQEALESKERYHDKEGEYTDENKGVGYKEDL